MENARKVRAAATFAALALCAVPADAFAGDVMYGGNFCTAGINDLNVIEHAGQFGVHNVSASTATVQCPFVNNFSGLLTVKEVDVTVYDRNPSTDVSCILRGIAIDGALISTGTKHSSGSSAPAQFLVFKPNKKILGTLNLTCDIPGETSNGLSHVTTYRLITTP